MIWINAPAAGRYNNTAFIKYSQAGDDITLREQNDWLIVISYLTTEILEIQTAICQVGVCTMLVYVVKCECLYFHILFSFGEFYKALPPKSFSSWEAKKWLQPSVFWVWGLGYRLEETNGVIRNVSLLPDSSSDRYLISSCYTFPGAYSVSIWTQKYSRRETE